MIKISGKTISQAFKEACEKWPEKIFLCSPSQSTCHLIELTFKQVAELVELWSNILREAGYGSGQRVAILVGTNTNHYIFKLALNDLGISCVPVNPDYTQSEIIYLIEDSEADLVITNREYEEIIRKSALASKNNPNVFIFGRDTENFPKSKTTQPNKEIDCETEASLLYTSGTTGKPKGCILSNQYELLCGEVYLNIKGPITLKENKDRIFNPLPSFHINAGVVTFFGAMLSGNCIIQPERFRASTWWDEIYETKATIFHYLGVVIAVLLSEKNIDKTKLKYLKAGLGAGVEPALHMQFEDRLNIPLLEVWGMTEMCRILVVDEEPRMINTRAMGKPRHGLEVRVVDENDQDVPKNVRGEMIIRHSQKTPRQGFFSGYLNKPEETEESWRNGWFHTGDTVTMDENNMIYFVDRSKNIIRRSGENISAAEVEDKLYKSELISKVACIAVADDIREEEVMACIVLNKDVKILEDTALAIFADASKELAYFKLPGWILFTDDLPITGTQKVVKHKIFEPGIDPRSLPNVFDLRNKKKRS